MQVNESIWGSRNTWGISSIVGSQMNVSDDYKIYQGNFEQGSQTYFNIGSLYKGAQSGKLKIDESIDNSMCYAALGAESPMSSIRYYDMSTQTIAIQDNRSVTNFCFATSSNINISNQPIVIRQYLGTNPTSTEWRWDRESRWKPFAKNPSDRSDVFNNNGYIEPIIQFSPKNFVLLIFVHVCADLDNIWDNSSFTLDDYINNNRYNDYPYITAVTIQPCFGKFSISERTDTGVNANSPTICILESLSVGDLMHDNEDRTLSGYEDYDICCGINKRFMIMGVGKTQASGDNTNGVLDQDTSNIKYYTPVFGNDLITHDISGTQKRFYMEYSDEIVEKIRRAVACFGLFFTGDATTAYTGDYTDDKMYMGVLDNFIGHGDYTKGVYNVRNSQYDWTTTGDSTYTPSGGGGTDPNTYRNTSGFNSVLNSPRDFNKRYVLSDIDIRTLNTDFFSALTGVETDEVVNTSLKTFYTNNPVDCIVSLKWFPFNLPQYGSSSIISLGAYATTVSAYQYVGSGVEVYNLGECKIFPHFGVTVFGGDKPCFLDYEPYTHIECIIPYCGTVRLNPSDVMGKTVKIMMTVDVYTGACVAYIMCDGLTIDTISGTISVNLPISGVATADLDAQIHTATMNYKSAKIQEATTVISSALKIATSVNPSSSLASNVAASGGTISNVVQTVANATQNLRETQYDLEHINVPFKSIGTNSALNGAKAEQFCSINITRPILHGNTVSGTFDVDKFAHTNGHACLVNGKVSEFTGYTQISDVDLSGIDATNEEKALIMNLLKGGVYL